MTFPRKLGVLFLIVAGLATFAHYRGISLPSLRWLYSFTADPDAVRTAGDASLLGIPIDRKWLLEHQAEIVGGGVCGILAVAGRPQRRHARDYLPFSHAMSPWVLSEAWRPV